MPRYKHWLPLDQDINGDPEVWEMTNTFGDRSYRTWTEILSILERTENKWRLSGEWLDSLSRKVRQKPATVQRTIDWMLARRWLEVGETLANGSPLVLSARNYAEYHRSREPKKDVLVPPLPKHPNLTSSVSLMASEPEPDLSASTQLNGNGKVHHQYSEDFESWWSSYPKTNGAKKNAWVVWEKLRREKKLLSSEDMILATFEENGSEAWGKGYVPHPDKWLRSERFIDIIQQIKATVSKNHFA